MYILFEYVCIYMYLSGFYLSLKTAIGNNQSVRKHFKENLMDDLTKNKVQQMKRINYLYMYTN